MPTIHVTRDDESQLQEIANVLIKARKVVAILGAGISTNSGIPDFRSENGLYTLIQSQCDAAAPKRLGSSDNTSPENPKESRTFDMPKGPSLTNVEFTQENSELSSPPDGGPPTKRRRLSPELPSPAVSTQQASEFENAVVTLGKLEKAPSAASLVPRKLEEQEDGLKNADLLETSLEKGALPVSQPQQKLGMVSPSESDTTTISVDDLAHGPGPPWTRPRSSDGSESSLSSLSHLSVEPRKDEDVPALRLSGNANLSFPSLLPFVANKTPSQSDASSPLSSPPLILRDPDQSSCLSSPTFFSQSLSSRGSFALATLSQSSSVASTPVLAAQSVLQTTSARTLPVIKGRDLFDQQVWSDPRKTSVFYQFATSLRQQARKVVPGKCHHFLSVLRDSRKLVRCYTQNIDQLEERVGLSTALELGPGSRHRFSTRSLRASAIEAAARLAEKGVEGLEREDSGLTLSQSSTGTSQEGGDDKGIAGIKAGRVGTQDQARDERKEQVEISALPNSADTVAAASVATRTDDSQRNECSSALGPFTPLGPNRGVECVCLHGSLAELRCFLCGKTSCWDEAEREQITLAGIQPWCPHCVGATAAREERGKRALGVGKLRPDIVLYGEEHPHASLIGPIVQHDLSLGPDLLLIMGTSMRVHGLKVLVREFARTVHARGGRVVFVNFTKPPESQWADIIDYWVESDCDKWVEDLKKRKPALWHSFMAEEVRPARPRALRPKANEKLVRPKEAKKLTKPKTPSVNPELSSAARPMAIRDHKNNGAYLVHQILQTMRRITGREEQPAEVVRADQASRVTKSRSSRSTRASGCRNSGHAKMLDRAADTEQIPESKRNTITLIPDVQASSLKSPDTASLPTLAPRPPQCPSFVYVTVTPPAANRYAPSEQTDLSCAPKFATHAYTKVSPNFALSTPALPLTSAPHSACVSTPARDKRRNRKDAKNSAVSRDKKTDKRMSLPPIATTPSSGSSYMGGVSGGEELAGLELADAEPIIYVNAHQARPSERKSAPQDVTEDAKPKSKRATTSQPSSNATSQTAVEQTTAMMAQPQAELPPNIDMQISRKGQHAQDTFGHITELELDTTGSDASVAATVKRRKRKQVVWDRVGGVEIKVFREEFATSSLSVTKKPRISRQGRSSPSPTRLGTGTLPMQPLQTLALTMPRYGPTTPWYGPGGSAQCHPAIRLPYPGSRPEYQYSRPSLIHQSPSSPTPSEPTTLPPLNNAHLSSRRLPVFEPRFESQPFSPSQKFLNQFELRAVVQSPLYNLSADSLSGPYACNTSFGLGDPFRFDTAAGGRGDWAARHVGWEKHKNERERACQTQEYERAWESRRAHGSGSPEETNAAAVLAGMRFESA